MSSRYKEQSPQFSAKKKQKELNNFSALQFYLQGKPQLNKQRDVLLPLV
jgi:hypothetical protein